MKIVVGILAVVLTISIVFYFIQNYDEINVKGDYFKEFAIGFGVFFILWIGVLRKKYFYSTFEHELTHLLVGLLFLKKPVGFKATAREGGVVTLYGGNFIITLAPYFLPTLSFLLLPLYLVIQPTFYPYFFGILGFLTSYHIFSTIQEFRYTQPDIRKAGPVFSTVFLIFANILFYGMILFFLDRRFAGIGEFLKEIVMNYKVVVEAIKGI